MMGAAQAVRGYTVAQIRPLIDLDAHEDFVPQTVPAYAATETFEALRDSSEYAAYVYKEATLNPTNKRDLASDWEADIIRYFGGEDAEQELVGERDTPEGRALWVARPITVNNQDCLQCHSTPDEAPASLISTYGDANGFGWQLGEVVGSQIVMVPMSYPISKARHTFLLFMGSLTAVFVVLFVSLNATLGSVVIQPITAISRRADQISLGHGDIPEFDEKGGDEIALLKASFNRMRRSLERAMAMIQDS
jgi:protein-histidine pros-kinase